MRQRRWAYGPASADGSGGRVEVAHVGVGQRASVASTEQLVDDLGRDRAPGGQLATGHGGQARRAVASVIDQEVPSGDAVGDARLADERADADAAPERRHATRGGQDAVRAVRQVGDLLGRHERLVGSALDVALGRADHRLALPRDGEAEAPVVGMLEGDRVLGEARVDDVDALHETEERLSLEAEAGQRDVGPGTGGIDDPAGRDRRRAPVERAVELDADDPPARLAAQADRGGVVAHLRAGILRGPQGIEDESLRQLDLGVPVERGLAQPLGREAGLDGRHGGPAHEPMARHRAPRREEVVERQAGAEPKSVPERLVVEGQDEGQRGDEVGHPPELPGALAKPFAHDPDVVVGEVAQAAMDEPRRSRRGAPGEVPPLDEQGRESTTRQLPGDAGAEDAATDDDRVIAGAVEAGDARGRRRVRAHAGRLRVRATASAQRARSASRREAGMAGSKRAPSPMRSASSASSDQTPTARPARSAAPSAVVSATAARSTGRPSRSAWIWSRRSFGRGAAVGAERLEVGRAVRLERLDQVDDLVRDGLEGGAGEVGAGGAGGHARDGATRVGIPVRRTEAGEGGHEDDAAGVRHRAGQPLDLVGAVDDAQAVSQPADGRAGHEDAALEGVGHALASDPGAVRCQATVASRPSGGVGTSGPVVSSRKQPVP